MVGTSRAPRILRIGLAGALGTLCLGVLLVLFMDYVRPRLGLDHRWTHARLARGLEENGVVVPYDWKLEATADPRVFEFESLEVVVTELSSRMHGASELICVFDADRKLQTTRMGFLICPSQWCRASDLNHNGIPEIVISEGPEIGHSLELAELSQPAVVRLAVTASDVAYFDVIGDGSRDNVEIQVRLAGSEEATLAIYFDPRTGRFRCTAGAELVPARFRCEGSWAPPAP